MKKLLLMILPFFLIFAFTGCKKDENNNASYEDITYEYISSFNGKYTGVYTESGGAQTIFEFTGKTWTKTIPGGKAPQFYIIQMGTYSVNGFNSTLTIKKGGKVVKTQNFTSGSMYLQYNTQ